MIPGSRARDAGVVAVVVVCALAATGQRVGSQSSSTAWTAIDLGTLGGAAASAYGVSDLAFNMVGTSTTTAGATHAFQRRMIGGMQDLGTLGGTNSEAFFVSGDGQYIVGRAQLPTGKYHAFATRYNGTSLTDLGTLGGTESAAYGVQEGGVVVGVSRTAADAATRAFVYRNGAMTPLDVSFGGANSAAFAINYAERIVGYAELAGGTPHAFLYAGGMATDLGSPGGASAATAINQRDDVAGYWMATDNASSHAFVYVSSVMQTLPGLGGAFAYARAITDNGDVVGEADTSAGVRHAVLWRQGAVTDLNSLLAAGSGWVLQAATGIDRWGNIAGYGTHNGQRRAFLVTPPIDLALSIHVHSNNLDTNIPNPHQAGTTIDLGATITNDSPHWATGVTVNDSLTGPFEYTSWDANMADCIPSGQSLSCRLKQPVPPGGSARDLFFKARATAAGEVGHRSSLTADQADPILSNNSGVEYNRAISLSTFTLNSPVVGGSPALGRVTLTSPAPAGGATVRLTTSNPLVATLPTQFDVLLDNNTGGLWREFYVTTKPVTETTVVQITATYGLVTIGRSLTILPSAPSSPYGGTPRAIPGTVQAEDYDLGGEGVAYHDADTSNNGGAYRTDGVDVERTTDTGGGYDVGWIRAGEWLKYTVNVASAGSYALEMRVASPGTGGTFHVEANGVDKTGPVTVPDTGGWQAWRSVTKPVTLAAGVQVLRVAFDTVGASGAAGNLNYLRLTATGSSGSTPYGGTPRAIPGTVQAEDFDEGGEGVAYHDTNAANYGGAYRSTGVDLEATTDAGGGYNVGWIAAGEWLKYTVNVASAGSYTLEMRVASPGTGGTFHVEANGVDKTGPVTVPDTGGWQAWRSVTKPVALAAGVQVLRVVFDTVGANGAVGNLNYVRLAAAGSTGSTPYGGTPRAIPGIVQAEDFDEGGEGVAYHDSNTANYGGSYRTTGVDIEATTDAGGGFDVGWMTAGEWLKYTVTVANAGSYTMSARVAANGAGGTFHVEANGANVSGPLTIPNTAGWQNWRTLSVPVTLSAGVQVLRLVLDANGATGVFGNVNYLSFGSATALPEVVLWTPDLTRHGAWVVAADSTAAVGVAMMTPDRGWATPSAPLASPVDYLEATFDAPAGVPYAVWIRLRATLNSKLNESVWVQFSDARTANGPIYPIGTPSGLLVNLEDCYNCGVSNWGWQNGAYWLTQYSTVAFAASGRHTIRIQVREDGAYLDQVVLSPSRYLLSAPGPVKNDATIVPK